MVVSSPFLASSQRVYKLQVLPIPLLCLTHSRVVQRESESCAEEILDTTLFLLQSSVAAETKSFAAHLHELPHSQKAFTTIKISLSCCCSCKIIRSPERKEDMLQIMVWELDATTTVREKQHPNSLYKSTAEESFSLARCNKLSKDKRNIENSHPS